MEGAEEMVVVVVVVMKRGSCQATIDLFKRQE
jgi:hypothetical protein